MSKYFILLLSLGLAVSCKAAPDASVAAPAEKTVEAAKGPSNAKDQDTKPGDALSPFEKDGSVKSSFPKGVVVRLNAITSRSRDTIDKFDDILPKLQAATKALKANANDAAAKAELTGMTGKINALYAEAKAAQTALGDEGRKLQASGNYYDVVIFSGMATFVTKVEKELAEQKAELAALTAK